MAKVTIEADEDTLEVVLFDIVSPNPQTFTMEPGETRSFEVNASQGMTIKERIDPLELRRLQSA